MEDDGGEADRRGLAKVLSVPSTAMGSSPATSGFFASPEKGNQRLFVESLNPSKGMSQNCWIPNKMVQCGKIVGISVENCKGGWDSLVAFARDRDEQMSDQLTCSKSKQKRKRELQGLRTFINYDRGNSHPESERQSSRGSKKSEGVMLVSK